MKQDNTRNVVSMIERGKERHLAPLREVEAYWYGLKTGDDVPNRSDVDPRGMEGALEYAFLAERIAPTMIKMRVAGTHLSDVMGMAVAGMPLSAFFTPDARLDLAKAVVRLFDGPCVLRLTLRGESGFGKPDLSGDLLLMPLRSDMGDVTRVLGCLVTQGQLGRTPRRFEIIDVQETRTSDSAPETRSTPAGQTAATPSRVFTPPPKRNEPPHLAEPVTPFRRTGDQAQGKAPHLRLVVSNDD